MRFAFGVEYDGSGFFGWQRQPEERTVQGCVEAALFCVANHEVSVVCAGRTDTGVHATGQVIHFETDSMREPYQWVRGVNANLPADIRVQWATGVDESFHSRFSAHKRPYRNVILNSPPAAAIQRKQACWEYSPLDEVLMGQAATGLLGEHDFTSFRAVACQAHSPVRTIYQLDVSRRGDFIYIDVVANAFLHHMVRCIAGVLIAVGRGEQSPGWVNEVLDARDRALSCMNAPPGGLYLVAVHYPEPFALPAGNRLPAYG
jgi:tRNA pseudouridine38-40 synthase